MNNKSWEIFEKWSYILRKKREKNKNVNGGESSILRRKGDFCFPFWLSFLSPHEQERMLRDDLDQKRTSLLRWSVNKTDWLRRLPRQQQAVPQDHNDKEDNKMVHPPRNLHNRSNNNLHTPAAMEIHRSFKKKILPKS